MKAWGWCIAVAGVVYLIIAFNLDVSIRGGDVANLDLMARRQNHVIVASLMTLVGVLMVIFGKSGRDASEKPTDPSSIAKRQFDGDRDLSTDAYRLWLANTYGIARNDVFDRFVIGEKTFDTLDDALLSAHASEQEKIRLADEARAAREASEVERQAEAEAIAAEAAAEWERSKPKMIAGLGILAMVVALAYFAQWLSP